MEIIARRDARSQGLLRYFTGRPCEAGHLVERFTSSGGCTVCANDRRRTDESRARRTAARHKRIAQSPPVTKKLSPRKAAKAAGLLFYRSAKACVNGHYSDRFVSNGACCKCVDDSLKSEEGRKRQREGLARRRATPLGKARIKAAKQARRAKEAGCEGIHSKQDIVLIFERQSGKCAACRSPLTIKGKLTYHVDHIKPLALGGTNWPHNLQLLCPGCNLTKGAKDPFDWARSRGMLI